MPRVRLPPLWSSGVTGAAGGPPLQKEVLVPGPSSAVYQLPCSHTQGTPTARRPGTYSPLIKRKLRLPEEQRTA